MSERQTVAVIGAGFSGLLTALRLLLDPDGPRVILIERGARFGRGAAYSTSSAQHLLNVRATNMSAFVEQPDHFLDWLTTTGADGQDASKAFGQVFVTRDRYGQYLQSLLRQASRGDGGAQRLVLEHDEVTSLSRGAEGWRLRLGVGRLIRADVVVLALGALPPPPPCSIDESLTRSGRYVRDPWAWDAAATPSQGEILLLGSGLTAVDIALSVLEQRPDARILSLSRHGLTPRRHGDIGRIAEEDLAPKGSPLAVLRQVRTRAGADWRGAIDALRPHVQGLWRGWSLAERQAFLRHLRPWWDAHRHRLAPVVGAQLDDLQADGTYVTAAGRLQWLRAAPGGLEAAWAPRGGGELVQRRFALAVNCSGPRGDVAGAEDALVVDLLRAGFIRPDACLLGLDVDARSRVVGRDGAASETLFAVGPITRGQFYEITSVPDIRVQAADCAGAILNLLHLHRRVAAPRGPGEREKLLAELAAFVNETIAELDVELASLKFSRRVRNAWDLRGRRAALDEIALWLDERSGAGKPPEPAPRRQSAMNR